MLGLLQYEFMRNALIVLILLACLIPMIGVVVVLKRLSTMGEALSHTSLAGVAIGLVAGVNPVVTAMLLSLVASLLIEAIRKRFPKYSEIAANIVLSAGIGLAAVFSGFVKNPADFNSFLFGSVVAVGRFEVWLVVLLSAAVILINLILYKELMSITLDEEAAALSGIPVRGINTLFTVMTAVTVSVAARTVGALMISSLVVVPVACSMVFARSYRQTMVLSVVFAEFFAIAGLFISVWLDLKPGGTIVLLGVLVLGLSLAVKKIWRPSNG